ncbi:uncharacterized [Tachysurus ichikawai]
MEPHRVPAVNFTPARAVRVNARGLTDNFQRALLLTSPVVFNFFKCRFPLERLFLRSSCAALNGITWQQTCGLVSSAAERRSEEEAGGPGIRMRERAIP